MALGGFCTVKGDIAARGKWNALTSGNLEEGNMPICTMVPSGSSSSKLLSFIISLPTIVSHAKSKECPEVPGYTHNAVTVWAAAVEFANFLIFSGETRISTFPRQQKSPSKGVYVGIGRVRESVAG